MNIISWIRRHYTGKEIDLHQLTINTHTSSTPQHKPPSSFPLHKEQINIKNSMYITHFFTVSPYSYSRI